MKQFTEIFVIVLIGAVIVWYASMRKAEEVHVQCVTTKGNLEIAVVPSWSPRAAERFLKMVDDGFFTRLPLFRCIENFVCQFGASFPSANRKTYDFFLDDPAQPALRYFKKGYLSFAGRGPNTRNNHIFIALGEVPSLGSQPWETPFAYVTDETYRSTVSRFTTQYGEMAPTGTGPDGVRIESAGGEDYLKSKFPDLDYFLSCTRN